MVHPPQLSAQSADVTDYQVDQLVEHLANIIKDRQQAFSEIQITGRIKNSNTGEWLDVHGQSYRGTVVSRSDGKIIFKTIDGTRLEVDEKHVDRLDTGGQFAGEVMDLHSHGGRTALATYALLSAGYGRHDPTVKMALESLEKHSMPGTYGRALRASIYSLLAQQTSNPEEKNRIIKLLKRDARWLFLAMNEQGGYTYHTTEDPQTGRQRSTAFDNSNTQFGVLGVWIASLAGYDVADEYWKKVDQFWTQQQNPDGGWGYNAGRPGSYQNMTIAGINSMILVLDQLYAKTAGKYVKFQGIKTNPRAMEEIARLRMAIDRGLIWLAQNGTAVGEAYTQLGIERLGLASGQKYIGTHDWYRSGAAKALQTQNWEGMAIADISMWLIFLSYGRAPILVNKLQWGGAESGWDYYYRDLYHACRFLTNTYEQIYKWQIIDTKATQEDLKDAPLLYITGESEFWLPDGIQEKIIGFVNEGGTIIGHANHANAVFIESFKKQMEKMLGGPNRKFRELPQSHTIYRTAFGSGQTEFSEHIPLWGLSDGYREMVILIPVDIAGAWHQSLDKPHIDLFHLFANLRFYCAPRYQDLPGRLRQDEFATGQARPWGALRVARVKTEADQGGAPCIWKKMNALMSHHYGVSIDSVTGVALDQISINGSYDLVHVAGQGEYNFKPEELKAIQEYTQAGGLVFIEAIGGDETFARSAHQQLEGLLGKGFGVIGENHDLLEGGFARGKPLRDLSYTSAARKGGMQYTRPPLHVMEQAGRTSLIFSGLDISVVASGQYVYGCRGYDLASARKILRNIILYRFNQLAKNPE